MAFDLDALITWGHFFLSPGFTRELAGGGSFDRCVLCACNNRSTECDEETGACRNCKLGTNGDRCQLCNSNVQEPECRSCKPGYWGLTPNGCTGQCRKTCFTSQGNEIEGVCFWGYSPNIKYKFSREYTF